MAKSNLEIKLNIKRKNFSLLDDSKNPFWFLPFFFLFEPKNSARLEAELIRETHTEFQNYFINVFAAKSFPFSLLFLRQVVK